MVKTRKQNKELKDQLREAQEIIEQMKAASIMNTQQQQSQNTNKNRKSIPVIKENRILERPIQLKNNRWSTGVYASSSRIQHDADIILHQEDVIMENQPEIEVREINNTYSTKEEKIWNLDTNKRKTFEKMYQAYEEARKENKIWCFYTSQCLQWIKKEISRGRNVSHRSQMIEEIPIIQNRKIIGKLQEELNLPEDEIGHWGNPIKDYFARGAQVFDESTNLEMPENPNRRLRRYEEINEVEESRNERVQKSYHQPLRMQYRYQEPEKGNRKQYEECQNRYSYDDTFRIHGQTPRQDTNGQRYFQYTQTPPVSQSSFYRNDLKRTADKIKAMETMIRVKNLTYSKDGHPRQ